MIHSHNICQQGSMTVHCNDCTPSAYILPCLLTHTRRRHLLQRDRIPHTTPFTQGAILMYHHLSHPDPDLPSVLRQVSLNIMHSMDKTVKLPWAHPRYNNGLNGGKKIKLVNTHIPKQSRNTRRKYKTYLAADYEGIANMKDFCLLQHIVSSGHSACQCCQRGESHHYLCKTKPCTRLANLCCSHLRFIQCLDVVIYRGFPWNYVDSLGGKEAE